MGGTMKMKSAAGKSIIHGYWMPAAVLLLGALSIALLAWTHRLDDKLRTEYIVVGALMDIQIHSSAFHLGLEEFIGGNPAVNMKQIWPELDAAIALSSTLLNGGKTEHGVLEKPLMDPEFRAQAKEIMVLLAQMKEVAAERLRSPGESGFVSALNQRFDGIYGKVLQRASTLENMMEAKRFLDQEKANRLLIGITSVWTIIVVLAAVGLRSRELRRRKSEQALFSANKQLQAQTEELHGHREHLAELVEKKTDELLAANRLLRLEIEEREHVEEALRISFDKYKALFDSTLDGLYQLDTDGVFVLVNHAGARILGYDSPKELIGVNATGFFSDRDIIRFLAELRKNKMVSAYRISARKNNDEPVELEHTSRAIEDEHGTFFGVEGIMRDVTHQIRLEAQLRQSQKIEAVGQLAGGIAHDFNNILTAIIGFATLAKMNHEIANTTSNHLEQILIAADRAAQMTQSLLTFSRKQIIDLRPTDLNSLVTSMKKMLTPLINEDIELKTSLSDHNLTIMADSGQIDQILMNLATNARDAMPAGGLITIETSRIEITGDFLKNRGFGKVGSYARLAVRDSGTGIDAATRTRIFEPFFTTKEVGKGTGLGLAIVYGIVKQHNGFIDVESESGRGTTIAVYLPLTVQGFPGHVSAEVPGSAMKGTETILVVEDNHDVRYFTKSLLEHLNYRVIEAVDGMDAVEKFNLNPDAVNLVIMDIIMPRMNGKEAFTRMSEIRPDVKVLFTSGHTRDVILKKGICSEGINFVSKPALPQELLRKVREALDGTAGQAGLDGSITL
jgi:PAS domain S-box-containing protein